MDVIFLVEREHGMYSIRNDMTYCKKLQGLCLIAKLLFCTVVSFPNTNHAFFLSARSNSPSDSGSGSKMSSPLPTVKSVPTYNPVFDYYRHRSSPSMGSPRYLI